MKKLILLASLFLFLLTITPQANAETEYASIAGVSQAAVSKISGSSDGDIECISDGTIVVVQSERSLTSSFNGRGRTYKHGGSLGNNQVFSLDAAGVTLTNLRIDDIDYDGTSSVVALTSSDNTVTYITLDNCRRYGIVTQTATNFRIAYCTILECQHGISGSTGFDGQWDPSITGVVEYNTITVAGVNPQHGVKLKNWQGVTVRYNDIDVTGARTGIIFGAGDASSVNCIVEHNTIHSSPKSGYGVVANRDKYTVPVSPVPSSGNIIRDNTFTSLTRTVLLRNQGYTYSGNTFTDCSFDYLGDYTITISGATITARNPSESTIYSGTNLGAALGAVAAVITEGKCVYIHSGSYTASTTAEITDDYITVIGVDATFAPALADIVTGTGTDFILAD